LFRSCLFSAILACIKFLCCLISECICSHNRRICFRNRELDPLVLSYLSVEDFSFTCIFNRPVYEKVPIPDTFGGKKNPFCIHSVRSEERRVGKECRRSVGSTA